MGMEPSEIMMRWAIFVIVTTIALGAYIRLAPSHPERWHQMPEFDGDHVFMGGVQRIISGDRAVMQALSDIIENSPRVTLLAGSVDTGMITYIARTKWIGFPDYLTIKQVGSQIKIYSRLRFGRSDLGVNAARLQNWLDQL